MYTLVLVRHGQSQWNEENRFTGWVDVDLTTKGKDEARNAALILKEKDYTFDMAYTSVLKRAIRTLWIILDEMDLMWLPVVKEWRLNERHYGALQGLNKAKTAKEHGEEQVHLWRRSFDISPPKLTPEDPMNPAFDPRYKELQKEDIPSSECLKQTAQRVLPFWENSIVPRIKEKKKILIVAHGNSLRALVKHLDEVSDEDISQFSIPTGVPLVYELDKNLKPKNSYFLSQTDNS